MRTLLDLMRTIEFRNAPADTMPYQCHLLLSSAGKRLKILDPDSGEEELIEAVSHEMARLELHMGGDLVTTGAHP